MTRISPRSSSPPVPLCSGGFHTDAHRVHMALARRPTSGGAVIIHKDADFETPARIDVPAGFIHAARHAFQAGLHRHDYRHSSQKIRATTTSR